MPAVLACPRALQAISTEDLFDVLLRKRFPKTTAADGPEVVVLLDALDEMRAQVGDMPRCAALRCATLCCKQCCAGCGCDD